KWRQRQKRGLRTLWKFSTGRPDLLEIETGAQTKFRKRGAQLAGSARRKNVLGVHPVVPKCLQRNKQLTVRRMSGQQGEDVGKRLCLSGLRREIDDDRR